MRPSVMALEDRRLLSTFTVTNTADSGTGSLRYEIGLANSNAGANTIAFDATFFSTPQTITLAGTQLELSNTSGTETITGPAAGVTVSGGGLSRVFQVDAGVSASISGLTISGGKILGSGGGGGLYDGRGSTTTLTNCTVSGNSAGVGGGLANVGGTTTLTNCTVSSNSAGFGGGVLTTSFSAFSVGGTTVLTNCSVSDNSASLSGGGVCISGVSTFGFKSYSTTTLTNCTVSGNSASGSFGFGYGGGLFTDSLGTTTLTAVTVSGNSAFVGGGGLFNDGTTTLTNCAISGDSASFNGGGVLNSFGTATLTDCTLSGNSAGNNGGGLSNYGTSTLTSCTVSSNSASLKGGGLANHGTATLTDCTVSGNSTGSYGSGGGLFNNGGTTTLANTIVAVNTADTGPDASGSFTSRGNNLVGETDGSSGWVSSDLTGTIAHPLNPLLEPLGNYGGPTQTIALYVSSPAIDAGNNALIPAGITTDQRSQPRIFNGKVDIGAYESQVAFLPSFVVNTTADDVNYFDGKTSLREAIAFANRFPGGRVITFDPVVFASAQTISLTYGQLDLSNTGGTETITGPKAGLAVSGGGTSTAFQVDSGVTAALGGLTISGGSTTGNGGGLYNDEGTTTLTNVTISGNSAVYGGGLYDRHGGTTTLTNCTLSGNSAVIGGGLANLGGTTTLANCIVSGNSAGYEGGGLENSGGATTMLTDCTVSGNSAVLGGGLFNSGGASLTVEHSNFGANVAQSFGFGGALFNRGHIDLLDSGFTGNSAGSAGGAVANSSGGSGSVTGCNVSGNRAGGIGGGISVIGGALTIADTSIDDNNSGGQGGGLVVVGLGTLTKCTVSGNSAVVGGGLANYGTTMLTNCTVSGNFAYIGGGVDNGYGTTTLTNCTVSGNSATSGDGGGLSDLFGTATLTNCTVNGNSASGSGGGLYAASLATTGLINCTVSGNSAAVNGGGFYNVSGTVTLGNTIVAKNTASTGGPDALGTFASEGNNLIGKTDGSLGWVGSDLTGTIAQPLDPLLAPLGNYGGPTQTTALLPGSPAIDAGNNALIPAGVTTDQRGLARIVNGVVDIGAFQSSGFTIKVASGSGQSTGVLTAFPAPLVVTVTASNPSEPVAGGLVTFTPPPSGASATLSGSPATISATGKASVTATANGIVGSYTVSAAASGITTPANFSLTNYPLILALDPSAAGALSLAGNASIKVSGVVYVDSSSSSALSASGNAQVKASAIDVHGKVQKSGNASLSPTPVTGAAVLAAVSLPSPSTMGMTNYGSFSLGGNSSATIQPGIYSQISVSGNAKLTMTSGIYIIEGGGFSISGNAGVTGSGVMIFNAGSKYPTSTGGTYGSITLSGTATCNLSPATSGTYAGIVFFQPVDNKQAITVAANASGITGTVYAPAAQLAESLNGALNASLIVELLAISGNGVAGSLALAAPSGVVGLTLTTPSLSTPSATAASPFSSSSSAGFLAWDVALADASTTGGTSSWVKDVSDAPGIDLTRVVFDYPFGKQRKGAGQFQA